MLIKYQSLKKKNAINIIHLSTSLGIMIMMLLNHYIQSLHKWLVILINLMNIKIKTKIKNKNTITMPLKVKDKNFLKITIKYGKKIKN